MAKKKQEDASPAYTLVDPYGNEWEADIANLINEDGSQADVQVYTPEGQDNVTYTNVPVYNCTGDYTRPYALKKES